MDQLAQSILFGLVIVVMGWFVFGIVRNIRLGNAVMKWLRGGLPKIGERTTLRWLGSSAIDLTLVKARAPFKSMQLLVVMEPRDVPWFWLIARAQGRRDMLIIRGQLLSAPSYEFDLLAPGSWSESQRAGGGEARQWTMEPLETLNFRAPQQTRSLSRSLAVPLLQAAQQVHPIVWRLSTRRDDPHLELHVPLPNPRQLDAVQFFDALRSLAEQASQR